jgi:hypothetical protein
MTGIDHEMLVKAMEKSNVTPKHLADESGKSLQYVCDIVSGRRTLKRNPALIAEFARICDVPVHWIRRRESA